MNKRGEEEKAMRINLVYLILLIIFVVGMFLFVGQQRDGAGIWEDYYAKEIVKVINLAEPGDEISIDVTQGTKIALEGEVGRSKIFVVKNEDNEVCVQLNQGKKTCYNYFNDVDVEYKLEFAKGTQAGFNLLRLKVFNSVDRVEKNKNVEESKNVE